MDTVDIAEPVNIVCLHASFNPDTTICCKTFGWKNFQKNQHCCCFWQWQARARSTITPTTSRDNNFHEQEKVEDGCQKQRWMRIGGEDATSSGGGITFNNMEKTLGPPRAPAAATASSSTDMSAVPPPDYNDEYKKAKIADAKAMNILAQTMSDEVFQKVADCSSAKAMWDTLNQIIAGSADERKDRRSNLISQYENFKKTDAESVEAMYIRLSSIINELRTLDKDISLTEVNDKILMCFPSIWDLRIWPIKEARSTTEISTEALLGKLKSFEQVLKSREAEAEAKTPTPTRKEQTLALKAADASEGSQSNEKLMTLFAKRFLKMGRKEFRKKSSKYEDKPRLSPSPLKMLS
ncbi:hypothetical protein KSP39_PZI022100 [Platanthera zijinensis]|uniref:Uncharacterized protein n=1 Tax=Platanthera zijinensis TaxID=2320716 RepID=A0AAP0FW23_9ASPA